jgi:hypothetical protein
MGRERFVLHGFQALSDRAAGRYVPIVHASV